MRNTPALAIPEDDLSVRGDGKMRIDPAGGIEVRLLTPCFPSPRFQRPKLERPLKKPGCAVASWLAAHLTPRQYRAANEAFQLSHPGFLSGRSSFGRWKRGLGKHGVSSRTSIPPAGSMRILPSPLTLKSSSGWRARACSPLRAMVFMQAQGTLGEGGNWHVPIVAVGKWWTGKCRRSRRRASAPNIRQVGDGRGGADAETVEAAAGRAATALWAHERLVELADQYQSVTLDGIPPKDVLTTALPSGHRRF